jgi:hypothetical protein
MTEHRFGTREEREAERDELLNAEKELTRRDATRPRDPVQYRLSTAFLGSPVAQ